MRNIRKTVVGTSLRQKILGTYSPQYEPYQEVPVVRSLWDEVLGLDYHKERRVHSANAVREVSWKDQTQRLGTIRTKYWSQLGSPCYLKWHGKRKMLPGTIINFGHEACRILNHFNNLKSSAVREEEQLFGRLGTRDTPWENMPLDTNRTFLTKI